MFAMRAKQQFGSEEPSRPVRGVNLGRRWVLMALPSGSGGGRGVGAPLSCRKRGRNIAGKIGGSPRRVAAWLVPADDPQVESRWVQRPVGQRTREPWQAGRQAGRRAATRPLRIYIHVHGRAHTFLRDRTRSRAPPLRIYVAREYTGCPVRNVSVCIPH